MTTVRLTTSLGDIELSLDETKAPVTVKNFLEYVDAGFYDKTIFHRVIPAFMVQGGGFDDDLKQKSTRGSVRNEAAASGLKNVRGTVAMARTTVADSATAQFFINMVDNASLDPRPGAGLAGAGYAVFGTVVKGMDVAEKIASVRTGTQNGMGDVPTTPVYITSAKRVD
ncbi:peptidylprolyl isomerase [Streptomyces anulatus]|uniref:peptidylprolyl isomerase n=1 Tax=Streptomyces anulatus TaxID=1892 RepID=UPI00364D4AC9